MLKDAYGNHRFFGIYRASVYDNQDPLNKYRLKVIIPQILGTQPTGWSWGVEQPGVVRAVPLIGEGVWIMFEGGDPSFPIWMGSFSTTAALTSTINYGAFSDYTTQSVTDINANYAMRIGQTDEASNVQIVDGTKVVFDIAGTYNLQWSGQFVNPGTGDEDAKVWMRKNGTDIIGSTGVISIPGKHGTTSGHTIAGWNFVFTVSATEYYEIVWSASSTGVTIQTYAATPLPPVPSTASLIVTVTQVK